MTMLLMTISYHFVIIRNETNEASDSIVHGPGYQAPIKDLILRKWSRWQVIFV